VTRRSSRPARPGALLGGGLRGRQGFGERGQCVGGAGEPDRDQRPVAGQLAEAAAMAAVNGRGVGRAAHV
jgi:hypothetical protein